MSEIILPGTPGEHERRRVERRVNAAIGELTLPEFRRILITTMLGLVVLGLFLWMVRTVVIAAILGLIIGFYIRPLHLWLVKRTNRPTLSAVITLLCVILPLFGIKFMYSGSVGLILLIILIVLLLRGA